MTENDDPRSVARLFAVGPFGSRPPLEYPILVRSVHLSTEPFPPHFACAFIGPPTSVKFRLGDDRSIEHFSEPKETFDIS